MTKLSEYYQKEIVKKLVSEFKIKNVMSVPKVEKIVVNSGLGEALRDKKVIENMSNQLAIICGQKPIATLSKKDISSFKLRKGSFIGIKVTLRGKKMYDFFERLVKYVLPRIRDFKGVKEKGFDNCANYTLGLPEQSIFPELEYSQIDKVRGLEITFVTTTNDIKKAKRLLELMGMPFEKGERLKGKKED